MTAQRMMRSNARGTRTHGRHDVRRSLMASGATAAAFAALLLSTPAAAQTQPGGTAFQGIGTPVVPGSATIVQTPTLDTITVNSPQAIIDWRPNDRNGTGTIDFLPAGLRALFTGAQDFTVLNRINPIDGQDLPIARLVALNGIINSQVNGAQGGSVWFYSAGGILVGDNARINVGSLVLTSRAIDTNGGLFGSSGEIRFRSPSIGNGPVTVSQLAQINATNRVPGSSYIALVAPRIVQAGRIRADGSVALVAAREADIRINQGLFDINVLVGTDDPQGIVHTGSTGGPADTSGTYESRAYLVAVPRGQAMTMLLSGNIGFETASSVGVTANGAIILSAGATAGSQVINGQLVAPSFAAGVPGGSITIGDTVFANDVSAFATDRISIAATGQCSPCGSTSTTGTIRVNGSADFTAGNSISLRAGVNQQLLVSGDLALSAQNGGTGGTIVLTADSAGSPSGSFTSQGLISVGNLLRLDSSGAGVFGVDNGNASGGTTSLDAVNGRIVAGDVVLDSNAFASLANSTSGGRGIGGSASVSAQSGGSISVNSLSVSADGFGGSNGPVSNGVALVAANGGDGVGGTALIQATLGGRIVTLSGGAASASGFGGLGSVQSGNGLGGNARLLVDGGQSLITLPFTDIVAQGVGGGTGRNFSSDSLRGGTGTGGRATVINRGGTANLGFLSVRADGTGGGGAPASSTTTAVFGGVGTGGNASLDLSNGTTTANLVRVRASGFGGDSSGPNGSGGNSTGGSAAILLSGSAQLSQFGSLAVQADGIGGEGDLRLGNGTGGLASLSLLGPQTLIDVGSIDISAGGYSALVLGGEGFAAISTVGGDSVGGQAILSTQGTITADTVTLTSSAVGGNSGLANGTLVRNGGSATGGSATFAATNAVSTLGSLLIDASAIGGQGGAPSGSSGNAVGGNIVVTGISNAVTTVTGRTDLIAVAGSTGGFGAAIGERTGGRVELLSNPFSRFDFATLSIDASALAPLRPTQSVGPLPAAIAAATGGTIFVTSDFGTIAADALTVTADAFSALSSTSAGVATGGSISLTAQNAGLLDFAGDALVSASAFGGSGTSNGGAVGGNVNLAADGGTVRSLTSLVLNANAVSGESTGPTASGAAIGGTVEILVGSDSRSFLDFERLEAHADAGSATASGLGGFNVGGFASFRADGGQYDGLALVLSADADGQFNQAARAGDVSFIMTGGEGAINFIQASANATGGDMAAGAASPISYGGSVEFRLIGGTLSAQSLVAAADGRGGDGVDGLSSANGVIAAGNGSGGQGGSVLYSLNGTAEVAIRNNSLSASGYGGQGGFVDSQGGPVVLPGGGGDAIGGQVNVSLLSGTFGPGNFFVQALGRSGNAGRVFGSGSFQNLTVPGNSPRPSGGIAFGGEAVVRLGVGTAGSSYFVDSTASAGEGGQGFAGGAGGDAFGGLSHFIVDNFDAGDIFVDLRSEGYGGQGGNALHGAGGRGGDGTGGVALFEVIGVDGIASLTSNDFSVSGFGGRGGDGRVDPGIATPIGFDGGMGGQGNGGTIELLTNDGALSLLNGGEGISLFTRGIGGDGGNGADNISGSSAVPTFGGNGGFGGMVRGGTVRLTANGGSIRTADGDDIEISADLRPGEGGFGGSGVVTSSFNPLTGVTTFFGGNGFFAGRGIALGGNAVFTARDSENGSGLIDLARVTAGLSGDIAGRFDLIDEATGPGIRLDSLDIEAFGGPIVGSDFSQVGSGVYVASTSDAIEISDYLTVDTDGEFRLDARNSGGLLIGDLSIFAGRDININHADNQIVGEGGSETPTFYSAIEADTVDLEGENVRFADSSFVTSGSEADIFARDTLSFGSLTSESSTVRLEAGGTIFGTSVNSATDVVSDSGGSTFIGSVVAGNSAAMDAGGSLVLDRLETGGAAALTAGGTIFVQQGSIGGHLFAQSFGSDIDLGEVTIGDYANIIAAGDVVIGSLTTAGGAQTIRAGRSVTLDNATSATTIDVTAGANAQIGTTASGGRSTINATGNIAVVRMTTGGSGQSQSSAPVGMPSITLNAGGDTSLGVLNSAAGISISTATLSGATSSLNAASFVNITATGNARFGSLNGGSATVSVVGDLLFSSSRTRADTLLFGATVTGTSAVSDTSSLFAQSDLGDLAIGTVSANGYVGISSNGNAMIGSLTSLSDSTQVSSRGNTSIQTANVAQAFGVSSGGNAVLGTITSGGNSAVEAVGSISVVRMTTTGSAQQSASPGAAGFISLSADGTITLGALDSAADIDIAGAALLGPASSITADGAVTIDTSGGARFGTLSASNAAITTGGSLTFTSSETDFDTIIRSAGTVAGTSAISDNANLSVTTTAGDIALSTAAARNNATLTSAGLARVGTLTTTSGNGSVTATGNAQIDNAGIAQAFTVSTAGNALIGTTTSGGNSQINAGGSITATRMTTTSTSGGQTSSAPVAGSILLTAGSNVALGDLDSAGNVTIRSATLTGNASTIRAAQAASISTSGAARFGALTAAQATINTGGTLDFATSRTTGTTTVQSAGTVTGTSAISDNANLSVTTTAGDITLTTAAARNNATLTSAGLARVGTLTTTSGNGSVTATGNAQIDNAGIAQAFTVSTAGNAIIGTTTSGGNSQVNAGGSITATRMTTTGTSGQTSSAPINGSILLTAGGNVALGQLDAQGRILVNAATLGGATSTLLARSDIDVRTSGNALFGSMTGGTALRVEAGGTLAGTLAETSGTGAPITLIGNNGVALETVRGNGTTTLTASLGSVTVAALRSIGSVSASGRSVDIAGTGPLDFATLAATAGNARVVVGSGTLSVQSGNASGSLTLTTVGGALTTQTLQAGSIALDSSSTATLAGNATATGALQVTSRGLTTINGVATGQSVRVTSGDIAIGATARVGTAGTTSSLLLTNGNSNVTTFIGGDAASQGYSLSASELLRLFANDITIRAPRSTTPGQAALGSTRPPDVVIGAFTLNGGAAAGGNLGSNGTLRIETPGFARVVGAAVLGGMSDANGFTIAADETIEVVLGQGSIRLNGANGLGGLLTLASTDVVVATPQAITAIASAASIADIDARLALNDGVLLDDGAIAAGGIRFTVGNGVFIQNSGASDRFADRRGFTAGSGGVAITTLRPTSSIVINGRIAGLAGAFTTGVDVIPVTLINGAAPGAPGQSNSFTAGSTINGCNILAPAGCRQDGIVIQPIQDNPLVDDDDDDAQSGEDTTAVTLLIDIRDVAPLSSEPLVDEPVTGSGNDDLWTAPDDEECSASAAAAGTCTSGTD